MIEVRKLSVKEQSEYHHFAELHLTDCPAGKTLLEYFLDVKRGQKRLEEFNHE